MKNLTIISTTLIMLLFLGIACTPKTAKVTKAPEVVEPATTAVIVEEGNCGTWTNKKFKDQALENHVLYRQELEIKNYATALIHWEKVFSIAPAADGKRDYQYTDGVKIYKGLIANERDPKQKEAHIKRIFELYEQGMECYPAKTSMYKGLKAYDLFYTYPGRESNEEVYQVFKDVIDEKGKDASAFIVNPFTSLLVNGFLEEKIPMAEAQKYTNKIFEIIARAKKELEAKNDPKWVSQGWDVVEGYAPSRLEQLEGVDNFYDCDYYKDKYYADFEAAKTNCDAILSTLSRLNRGKCSEMDAKMVALKDAKQKNCVKAGGPRPGSCTSLARTALEQGDYKGAIGHYETCIADSDDNNKKSLYALTIAKIYYGHLKQFSKSRKYARKAISFKSNNGAAYILIGKLYASSGPLCGPGRGWDSQVVTWPAIDKWKKAKSVDSSVAAEANKLIGRYQQYMPSKEDVFQKLLKKGDPYTVECWIQEKTTVRAAQ